MLLNLCDPKPEGNVVVYVKVREKSVFLKNSIYVSLVGRNVVYALSVKENVAAISAFKAAYYS